MSDYKLRYLPIFFEDLEKTAFYIASNLRNPKAADDLVDDVENAIIERVPICEDFEPYHSLIERKHPYYRIYVKNYVVYYVVIDDESDYKIMEVRRLLYKGRDRKRMI
ncbi:MAG: type II toxin-antitoxin system RelE/ParE family toxin [Eubacteriales bacterium]|nr:type II toxin-antitoxin system RelE/ParE family toxin [Eubacteriales bacterium]